MKLVLNFHVYDRFLWDGAGNLQNHLLCFLNALLISPDSNCGICLKGFVHIDLSTGLVLDLVDFGPSFAKDPGDCTSRDFELDRVVILPFEFQSLEMAVNMSIVWENECSHPRALPWHQQHPSYHL